MKKTFLLLAHFLLALAISMAQPTNQKIVFSNPANMEGSEGQYLLQTADGGYLLAGTSHNNATGNYAVPRLIKLSADLQTTWDKHYLEQSPPHGITATLYSPACQTADGGYAMAVRNDSTSTDFLRLDANGNVLWEKDLVPWSSHLQLLGVLPDGGFEVAIKRVPYLLMRLDANGNTLAQKDIVTGASNGYISSVLLANTDVLTAFRDANGKGVLQRNDADGNLIWRTPPITTFGLFVGTDGSAMTALSDGGFAVLGSSGNQYRIFRFDAGGNLLGQTPDNLFPATLAIFSKLAVTADSRYLVSGKTTTNRGFCAQLNSTADAIEWSAESPEDGQEHLNNLVAIPSDDGWAAGVSGTNGNKFGFLKIGANSGIIINTLTGRVAKDDSADCIVDAAESGLSHARVSATNGLETFGAFTDGTGNFHIDLPSGNYTLSVASNEPFFELCTAANLDVSFPAGISSTATRDLPMDMLDLIHEVKGTLYLDQNSNCMADNGEPTLSNWNVAISFNGGQLNLKTDANGNYKTFLPNGVYEIVAYPFNNNFLICSPATQSVSFSGPDPETQVFDFVAQPEFLCARMRADLSAALRPCLSRTIYAAYRNDGTVAATGATMKISLDPLLAFESANPAPDMVDGQTLTFNLGDVPASPGGEWEYIAINVKPDCTLNIGDQVCISAAVTPDEDCSSDPNWNGAIVSADGTCNDDDEAVFIIKNVGTAPNAQALNYIITEDLIILREGTFQLNPGEEKRDTLPGNGLPLTLIAQQEPGYPGDTSVVWNIVNCGGSSGGQATGFGGSAGPFIHQECFTISNSFDPNDKNAVPEGHGPAHFVHPGTPLEYRIRFQNTGNDTAFLVVIRDTLDAHFNLGTVEPRSASHRYEFAQINDNIVQFTFNNIQLPDSSANLEGSQGFVEFSVYPKENLPDGTEVLNRAAIYFDFNAPVITNTVSRVYGKYVFLKTSDEPGKATLPVQVYPNPFMIETTFELPETHEPGEYQLHLLDASGRSLRNLPFSGNKCLLRREALPAGVFAWSILTGGKTVAGGTVLAQ